MTATIYPIKPNSRTHERLHRQRQVIRDRLIVKIGTKLEDAPLFDENLRALAYGLWMWDEAMGLVRK